MSEQSNQPGPGHRRLEIFVGTWKTEGRILDSSGPSSRLTAVDTYEWMPGEFFLLHHVDGRMGDEEVKTLEVIGFDAASQGYRTHSFDNHGNAGTYTASLHDRAWKIWGETERFTGEFAEDGSTLAGQWERATDGELWQPWMEITLTKVS
jgi:hypothetical protein